MGPRGVALGAHGRPGSQAPHPGLCGRARLPWRRGRDGRAADLEPAGGPVAGGTPEPHHCACSAAAMPLGTGDPASETVRAGGPPDSLQLAGSARRGAGWRKAAHGRRRLATAAITVTAQERTSVPSRARAAPRRRPQVWGGSPRLWELRLPASPWKGGCVPAVGARGHSRPWSGVRCREAPCGRERGRAGCPRRECAYGAPRRRRLEGGRRAQVGSRGPREACWACPGGGGGAVRGQWAQA